MSWRVAWGRAAGVLVVCLMAAAVVVLGWRQLSVQQRPEQPAPRAEAPARVDAPAPISEPAVAPSPPLPSTTGSVAQKMTTPPAALDPDSIYLQLLSDAGVKAPTREKAIANGRLICQQLAQAEVDRVNPSLGVERANGTVYAAIDAYCPQFEDRGGY
ncbi:hypothetical protein A5646_12875 [Mycobacterium sp. 1245499.0]|nr:hypothetical protein A5646_12875 [Mycobacterium sp. 1245499.0]